MFTRRLLPEPRCKVMWRPGTMYKETRTDRRVARHNFEAQDPGGSGKHKERMTHKGTQRPAMATMCRHKDPSDPPGYNNEGGFRPLPCESMN